MIEPALFQSIPEGFSPVGRAFYQRPAENVAGDLLGRVLLREGSEGRVLLRIVETEAYLGVEDPACHTFGGRRTPRVSSMWGEKGHAYIYLIYGIHHCLNAVCGRPGVAAAVLVRGAWVLEGEELVRRRRGGIRDPRRLSDGPGKLCQALALSREMDGVDLCDGSQLRLVDDGFRPPPGSVERTPRIGIDSAGEAASWPLRFLLRL